MTISTEPRQAAVVSTTICHLSAREALDFADYLESQNLADTLLDQRILNCTVLKEPSEEGFFLDQMLIAPASSDAVQWLRDRRCHRFAGCRVSLYEAAAMDDLLEDYQGGRWDNQGYTVVVASAIEIAIALELRECPCMLQLELPGVGYTENTGTPRTKSPLPSVC